MKKTFLLLIVSLFMLPAFAQNDQIAPTLTKEALISFLQDNYSVSNPLGYNSARDAMYGSIDNKNGNIVCVYTGYTITANTRGDAFSKGINTEHTWPQGMFDKDEPMRGDIHHLFPTVIDVNGDRSNFPFDEIPDNETDRWYINTDEQTSIPTSNIDEYSELLSGSSFEPREDHKGNVARAIFYFWAIYQNTNDVSDDASFFNGMKDVLLTWHDLDAVDDAEVARSLGAESAQGNKNPFVHDTTLVRRAFFDGVISEPDPVPNPVLGKITNIQSDQFSLTYTESEKERTVIFEYSNALSAKDTADNDFTLSDYETIKEAQVIWEEGNTSNEFVATSLSVIDFGENDPDTVITGPIASFNALLISGVMDGTLSGGTPKTVELFATEDIPDLGVFGLGAANNGGGTDGVEFMLTGSAAKGDFIYISTESANFNAWFGFNPDLVDDSNTSSVAINGDDAVELFYDTTKVFSGNEIVVDTFGDIAIDGSGKDWEYLDGWVYRKDFTGPDSTSFNIGNWNFSGPNALDNESSNASASSPFPAGTFQYSTGTNTEIDNELPKSILLKQNYPNPFNPNTVISFEIRNAGFVTLKVYNMIGREVSTLVQGKKSSGLHQVTFDATTLPSGVYMYRMTMGSETISRKMLLIK